MWVLITILDVLWILFFLELWLFVIDITYTQKPTNIIIFLCSFGVWSGDSRPWVCCLCYGPSYPPVGSVHLWCGWRASSWALYTSHVLPLCQFYSEFYGPFTFISDFIWPFPFNTLITSLWQSDVEFINTDGCFF